jgi:hypothetical protein
MTDSVSYRSFENTTEKEKENWHGQMQLQAPILCVDFDGVISPGASIHDFDMNALPTKDCISVLNRFHNLGCRIIIWTCREDSEHGPYLTEAVNYMKKYGIPYDYLNDNVPEWRNWHCRKVIGTFIIDDLNLGGFPGWLKAEEIILKHPYFKGLVDSNGN